MTVRVLPDFPEDPGFDPRSHDLATPGEWGTLLDYLHHYRLSLVVKCAGLTPEQLATRAVPPSSMSLLGMVRHMARVEHFWFRRVMGRAEVERIYPDDAGFGGVLPTRDCLDDGWAAWQREVAFAEAYLAGQPSLDSLGSAFGREIPLREVLVHLIEEYARHCGHADLLREVIDGRTGD